MEKDIRECDESWDTCEICECICEGDAHRFDNGTIWCNTCYRLEQAMD